MGSCELESVELAGLLPAEFVVVSVGFAGRNHHASMYAETLSFIQVSRRPEEFTLLQILNLGVRSGSYQDPSNKHLEPPGLVSSLPDSLWTYM